ncbi:MAG: amidohydrolase [Polyangiaceae bacterium]|nr:amidohydrolase [Polyangiaceae bacterium]
MKLEDMILVSVDDHIVEPPTLFDKHLPAAYKDKAPKVIKKNGADMWEWGNVPIPNLALNAVVGRPKHEYGMEPTSYEQLRKGTWDIDARIDDMNANGQLASLCFPSFPGLNGSLFCKQEDKKLAHVILQAYNDWHVDEWCGSKPGRFIPNGLVPLWDPQLMADEVRRLAKKGCHAVSFSENPEKMQLGLPSLHSKKWDPFWQACSDEGTIVNVHIGSGEGMAVTSMEAPVDVMITIQPMAIASAASDILWSSVLRRFPKLKFALSEGGIGWIPYFLERVDYVYEGHHQWTHQDFGDKKPSDVFKEQIATCFIDDRAGVAMRKLVGVDNINWECDYPHSDTSWPKAPEALWEHFEDGVSDEDINKMTHLNAMKLYSFDPFKHIKREDCTVGALRAQAKDVDLSIKGSQGGKAPITDGSARPVTIMDVAVQLMEAQKPVDKSVSK